MKEEIEKELELSHRKREENQGNQSDSFKKPQQSKDTKEPDIPDPASMKSNKSSKKFNDLTSFKEEIERQIKAQSDALKKKTQESSKQEQIDTNFWKKSDKQQKEKTPGPEPESPWKKYFELVHKHLDRKYPYLIAIIIGLAGFVWLIDSENKIRSITEEVHSNHARSSSEITSHTVA